MPLLFANIRVGPFVVVSVLSNNNLPEWPVDLKVDKMLR